MDIPIIHLHTLSKELKFCLTIDKKYNPLVFIYLQVIKDKFSVFHYVNNRLNYVI